jgi:EmrB/QacA subfamily drug resistance transporter
LPADRRVDGRTWKIAGVVTLGGIMSSVDTTLVNVALESFAHDFHASITDVQWISTGYLLGLVATIPLAGWAAERFGAKRVWIVSVVLFVTGSGLAGAAWSLESLIAFRVLQGVGGGMVIPVGQALMTSAAGSDRMGRVLGILGVQQLLGPVVGPVLGGLVLEQESWRWIFFVNVPVAALAIPLAVRLLPAEERTSNRRFDGWGVALITPGLAAVIYGLTEVEHAEALTGRSLLAIAVGGALVATFAVRAVRGSTLIDVSLFRARAFAAGASTTFFLGEALYAVLFLLPLYYQGGLGVSPLHAGLLLVPQGIGAAIAIPLAGRASDRFGSGPVVMIGLVVTLAGTVPFALAGRSVPSHLLAVALLVRGVGMGTATMPASAGAYAAVEKPSMAQAAAQLNLLRRVGGSLGVAVVATVLERDLPGNAGAVGDRVAPEHAIAAAFGASFWCVAGFCALAALPAAFLPWRPLAPHPTHRRASWRDAIGGLVARYVSVRPYGGRGGRRHDAMKRTIAPSIAEKVAHQATADERRRKRRVRR